MKTNLHINEMDVCFVYFFHKNWIMAEYLILYDRASLLFFPRVNWYFDFIFHAEDATLYKYTEQREDVSSGSFQKLLENLS